MSTLRSYRSTSSKRKKAQRTSLLGLSVRRLLIFIVGMSLCVLILLGYLHSSTLISGTIEQLEIASAQLGFKLEDVIVEGRTRTDKILILDKLELKRGKPLLSINLLEAKTKLEELAWVKAVRIERRIPNTLFIRLSEKEPVALWLDQDKAYLVDRDGELIETNEIDKHQNLLLVAGHQAPREIGKLVALLEKFPEIRSRVTAATHLRSARWDLRLDDRVDIKLPEKEPERALSYLLDLEKAHYLIKKEVMTIDMRLPGQLILRLTPDASERKNDTGKDA